VSDILGRVQDNGRNAQSAILGKGTRPNVAFMGRDRTMRDPELVARAGYAAARLEQAWERWRALHGLGGSADPLASYVGYSLKEPMGQPRVVIGVDAAEAEFFADFLESHASSVTGTDGGLADASPAQGTGLTAGDSAPLNGTYSQVSLAMHAQGSGAMLPPVSGPQRVPANGSAHPAGGGAVSGPLGPTGPAVSGPIGTGPMAGTGPMGTGPAEAGPGNGPAASVSRNGRPGATPAPRDVPSAPMVRLLDGTDPATRPGPRFEPAGPRFEPAGPRFEPAGPRFDPAGPLAAPVGTERPVAGSLASAAAPAASVFPAIPADPPGAPVAPNGHADHDARFSRAGSLPEYPRRGEPAGPPEPPDAIAAEMAGWASGELPGQASEQLASWAAGESGGRRLRRSRSAR
jgi:hypothetical protein